MDVEQQFHAYVSGHELVASSIKLASDDQETVDRLSDMAGTLGPGERCPPYLTGYPLPRRSHFVLARTWYDDAAPRAGCVLTHSLLIPMPAWRRTAHLATLRELFVQFDKARPSRKLPPLHAGAAISSGLAPVLGSERAALAEAIFLEERAPIVVFECSDSETTALRLVQAMWPALREKFAFCTFALQPRSAPGRDFDLLFAPAHARSRFAKWSGRRIDAESGPANEPRHRWSKWLVQSIFEDSEPSLIADDPLGILARDEEGDSGRLRLALLWQDLHRREHESPTAVLGMLDVLSSMRLETADLRARSEPLIVAAAKRASIEMRTDEGIRFLSLLIGKLPPGRPNGQTLAAVSRSAFELAARDPAAALANVPFETASFLGVRAIARGIGRALAGLGPLQLFELVSAASHDVIARLLGASAQLCHAVVLSEDDVPTRWWSTLASVVSSASPFERRRLRRRLLPLLSEPAHVALMRPLLTSLSPKEVAESLDALWPALTGPEAIPFEQAIADTLLPTHREPLREAILVMPPGHHVPEHLLLRVLQPTEPDFSLLLAAESIDDWRRPGLLAEFLERLSDGEVEQLVREAGPSMERAVGLLAAQSPPHAPRQIARVLRSLELPAERLQTISEVVIGELDGADSIALAAGVLPRLLLGDHDGLPSIRKLVEHPVMSEALRRMGSARLVDMFVPTQRSAFDGARQSAAIELIESSSSLQTITLERVDEVARRLAARREADLTLGGLTAWARLLDEARGRNMRCALRADVVTLRYAIERRPLGGSVLALATFAPVYQIASSREPSSDVDTLFSFLDWDRAKTLRGDLISTYLRSNWPPGDLMVIAERAAIGRKMLKRLGREYRGEEFIERMKNDLRSRSDAQAFGALQAIVDFERNPPNRHEWD